MGNVYIFRGKAAAGKTTLVNMLSNRLSIAVIRKDDVADALKMTETTDKELINNRVCYNVLYKILQTNLNLGVDFIVDTIPADTNNAKFFLDRLDFKNNKVYKFLIDCSDEQEWRRRHEERLENPLPHQVFKSFEHVTGHYKNADFTPLEHEYMIDTADRAENNFNEILKIISE